MEEKETNNLFKTGKSISKAESYVARQNMSEGARNSLVPTGAIIGWPPNAPIPPGFVDCDGTSYLKEDYEDLFDVIGYYYGGAANRFNVPTSTNEIIKA